MMYNTNNEDTRNWCTACYRKRHQDCSGIRNVNRKQGGRTKDGSNRVPCECVICYPLIRVK